MASMIGRSSQRPSILAQAPTSSLSIACLASQVRHHLKLLAALSQPESTCSHSKAFLFLCRIDLHIFVSFANSSDSLPVSHTHKHT